VDDRVRGLDMGADDYVVKPFNWAELLARVRAAIRRPHGHKSATLTVGDLEIDTVGKSVRRAGKPVELTAREYALLEYLAHREGQVVTRTDIWEQLYGHDDPTTRNVRADGNLLTLGHAHFSGHEQAGDKRGPGHAGF
jgi:DNA-binding response OmpR family regulator